MNMQYLNGFYQYLSKIVYNQPKFDNFNITPLYKNFIMPIILNEEQQSCKYDLLKESLRDQVAARITKNHSFSNQKHPITHRTQNYKSFEDEISDWGTENTLFLNQKSKQRKFALPEMKYKPKSKNIQELSRQLLKYEQFNMDHTDDINKFRLSFLRQMTKINFKKNQLPKQMGSPKKINIKLQFPQRYQKFRLQNQEINNMEQFRLESQNVEDQINSSLYAKRPSQGLIPSIKKLVSSSFPKKSIYRSQSQREPYQHTKLFLNKNQWQNAKKSITEELQEKFGEKQKMERQRKVKLSRLERKLPLNFLSYSHKKNSFEKEKTQQQEKQEEKKKKKSRSPYLSSLYNSSFYPSIQKINDDSQYEQKRLSQCIVLKKVEEEKNNR